MHKPIILQLLMLFGKVSEYANLSLTRMQTNRFVNGRPINIDFPHNTLAPLSTLRSSPAGLK